ncbi:MAG: hypothetical protein ACK5RL_20600 [Acidimicrobiales bacterium]
MDAVDDIYPVLRPAAWLADNPDAAAHVWLGTTDRPLVLVTYAHLGDDGALRVLDADGPPSGGPQPEGERPRPDGGADLRPGEDVVRAAFANLDAYETAFEAVDADGGRMLVSAGRALAAERVLSQAHMLAAHELLDAEEVLVSIPRRGAVLACSIDCSDQVRRSMMHLHTEAWAQARSESDRITGELVVFEQGVKTGRMPIAELKV